MANNSFRVQTLALTAVLPEGLLVSYTTIARLSDGSCHTDLAFADPLRRDLEAAGFSVTIRRVVDGDLFMWLVSGIKPLPAAERDAVEALEVSPTGKLTGQRLRLPSGAMVTVERSNGFVMSGWDAAVGWWSIDLRNDRATVIL